MASSTQFRQYHIAQDAGGHHIEVVRDENQVAVLAFDTVRQIFVICHVLVHPLNNAADFSERLRRLQGPGQPKVARLFESGEDEGNKFYIVSLVDGETLQQYLARQSRLPSSVVAMLVVQALEAARDLLLIGDLMLPQPLQALRVLSAGEAALELRLVDFLLNAPVTGKSPKASALRSAFGKQATALAEFCGIFQKHEPPSEVNAVGFAGHLSELLTACVPGVEPALEECLTKWRAKLAEAAAQPPWKEGLQPRPLLAAYLPETSQAARAVRHHVRAQSQQVDAAQPYAIGGLLMKTNQPVLVEPLAPLSLTGPSAAEALREVQNLPKTGKFPNLVPVVFVEEQSGIRCVAEAAVEGVSLRELLTVRRTLDVQETYLILAGLDVALTQLEKAKLGVRHLRLEDIFLFTGFNRESPRDTGLLTQKLDEWPGFSIVLRIHGSLHGKGGRGVDPSVLLPVQVQTRDAVEPFWHGGWMAALGSFLCGRTQRDPARPETGIAETDTVFRLLDDELDRTIRGEASTRSGFLARFARVMQQFHLAQFTQAGGFWTELSGSTSAQDRAAEVSQAVARPGTKASPLKAPPPAKPEPGVLKKLSRPMGTVPAARAADPEAAEDSTVGFAEVLMSSSSTAAGDDDVHPFFARSEDDDYEGESSWVNMREEKPFLLRLFLLLAGAMIIGAALAHLSGRALWQLNVPAQPTPAVLPEPAKAEPVFDLPVAPSPAANVKKDTPAPAPQPAASSKPAISLPVPQQPLIPAAAMPSAPAASTPAPSRAEAVEEPADPLTARLREVRASNGKLTPALRQQAEKAAEQGNAEAMLAMGRGWLNGDFGKADDKLATVWLEKGVTAGSGEAMTLLADCYMQGRGVEASPLRAVQLLQSASEKGVPEAKDKLGVCYARGIGTEKNDLKAFQLCQEAYTAGVPGARGNLGAMYLRGQGVAPDAERAVQLFKEGARMGHAESMLALAQCLEYGNGTRASLEEATQWYRSAAREGNAEAVQWCREKRVAY